MTRFRQVSSVYLPMSDLMRNMWEKALKKKQRRIAALLAGMFLCLGMLGAMTVEAASKKVTKVSVTNVTGSSLRMSVGKTYQLKASVSPKDAKNSSLLWSSSNKSIATVSSTGKLKARKVGKTKVTVKSKDNPKAKKTITVTVKSAKSTIQKITLQTKKQQRLIQGETYQIKAKTSPVNNGVSYRSSNTKVVKVSATGKVTAVGAGTATVTVKAKDTDTVWTKLSFKVRTYEALRVGKTQSVAHMGLIYEAPSNSVPAYKKAAVSNAFMGIEADLQETADGEFVMIHDADISSRTDGSGLVSKLSLKEVVSARMTKGTNISQYPNLHIPTVDEYLSVCKQYGMRPVIHIKSIKNHKKLLMKLKQHGLEDKAIITGSKAVVSRFRTLDKRVTLSWLCYMTKSNIDWAAANKVDINVAYQDVTQELIDYAHDKNLTVGAWTVNNHKEAKRILYKGVDFITGDYKFAIY